MSNDKSCYCAANGCPLLGVMSTGTNGGDWWCYLHFGKDGAQLQALTTEINRREWLAKAITDIRMHYGKDSWPSVYKAVKHELAMQQRNDLQMSDASVKHWLFRLERELQAMVRGAKTNPERQERMTETVTEPA